MNRVEIKKQAKELIKGNIWYLLFPFFIIGIINGIVGWLTGGFNTDVNTPLSSLYYLVTLALIPVEFGVTAYILNFIRNKKLSINYIFSFYKKFWPIFALEFLVGLFSTLWSLLLFIPGIIAALKYSMSIYIMIDGEDDALQCINKSKKMTYGYKSDYFAFILSFIGWYLLVIPTFGLILLYVIPYVNVSKALYYEELKKITK